MRPFARLGRRKHHGLITASVCPPGPTEASRIAVCPPGPTEAPRIAVCPPGPTVLYVFAGEIIQLAYIRVIYEFSKRFRRYDIIQLAYIRVIYELSTHFCRYDIIPVSYTQLTHPTKNTFYI